MHVRRTMNKVQLIGNLTRDPETEELQGGELIVFFGLATESAFRNADGEKDWRVDFHNIVAYGKLAEICIEILAKGMLVYVEGEIRYKDGDVNLCQIKIREMYLCDDKGKEVPKREQTENKRGFDILDTYNQ